MRRAAQSERGAALLAVLLLVAVMGAIAAAAFERLSLSTALAVNGAALDQARAHAAGVETLLQLRIDDLKAHDPEKTTLAGDWHGVVRRIPMPGGGVAEGAITDGGNCFNLNSLVQGDAASAQLSPRGPGIEQFAGLMRVLGAPEGLARPVAEAAADWADSDSLPSRVGAEDQAYGSGERPYRAANTLFAEVSELRAVAGMTPELYDRLRPYLCALPATDLSPINVNTLQPHQAPLLAMLAPGAFGLDRARMAIARRPERGFSSIDEFLRAAGLQATPLPFDPRSQLQLRTSWFALDLRVEYQGAELIETALVDARYMPSRLAVRRWGNDE